MHIHLVLYRSVLLGHHSLHLLLFGIDHSEPAARQHSSEHQHEQYEAAEGQLDHLSHKVDAEHIVCKFHFIRYSLAIGSGHQSGEGVGDEVVESGDCTVELIDPGIEGGELRVEVIVAGEEGGELVLDGLEEIESAVPEGDEGGAVVECLIVGCGVILADLDVSHGEIAEGPAGSGRAGDFLIE